MVADPSQNLPATSKPANTEYLPLHSTDAKPSIRLAVLQPSTRESSIRLKLVHTTFADRPKYEALSYVWGGLDAVKNIGLNGRTVEVRENLWLALVHLRDTTEERLLWIDAICINQADLEERNQQVQMMAFIYSRAQTVLVWLGVITVPDHKHPKSKAEHERETPEAEIIHLLTLQPYWSRVWIVQEVGSATNLEVHWGLSNVEPVEYGDSKGMDNGLGKGTPAHSFISKSESWDAFFGQVRGSGNGATTLAQQRKGRHGDDFLLANLMEACQRSKCQESRDKVYGFVGIAHDCQDGKFPVDYSKSLFELYEDLIYFHVRSQVDSKSIVYFSQLVQQLFGGPMMMHEDLERSGPLASKRKGIKQSRSNIEVIAHYYGTISLVGPSYSDYIALPQATRQWKAALSRRKPRVVDWSKPERQKVFLEQLRASNERLTRMLYDIDPSNLSKQVTTIAEQTFWDGTQSSDEMTCSPKTEIRVPPVESRSGPWEEKEHEPRLFCTDEEVVGLMPPYAQRGDALFIFHKSNIVAVVRSEKSIGPRVSLIGRALAPGKMSLAELEKRGVSRMMMDIRILQLLTAYSVAA